MRYNKLAVLFLSSVMICSCTKEQVGTSMGAVAGGIVGSAFGKGTGNAAMIAVGAAAGAMIGNQIGASLDQADRQYYNRTAQQTFENAPAGMQSTWRNPDSGNHGTMVVNRTFQASSGGYCREFTQKIYVGQKVSEGYGTACRQPDGTWKIVG